VDKRRKEKIERKKRRSREGVSGVGLELINIYPLPHPHIYRKENKKILDIYK